MKLAMSRNSPFHLLLLLRVLSWCPGASGQQRQEDGPTTTTTTPPGNATREWEGTWSGYTGQDYRKEIFPPVTPGEPLQVGVSVQVRNLPKIDEEEGLVVLEINLRVRWRDKRLRPPPSLPPDDYLPLDPAFLGRLWVPDLYIAHSEGGVTPSLLTQIASVWIYGNATVDYSGNMFVRVSCSMNYNWFPRDHQICLINMQSYAYTLARNEYIWMSPGLEVGHTISSEQFLVRLEKVDARTKVEDSYGAYPALAFRIHLTRRLSSVLLQLYLPSALFVVVSFVSFLVPPDAIPGRITLCITTILTMSTLLGVAMQSTPRVSYVRAIDVWLLSCLTFVSLVLLEFGAVIKLEQLGKRQGGHTTSAPNTTNTINTTTTTITTTATTTAATSPAKAKPRLFSSRLVHPQVEPPRPSPAVPLSAHLTKARQVERLAAYMFPGAFLLFNMGYWWWFLTGSQAAVPEFVQTVAS
ncbi:glycine receptor subunit alpha-2-like [Portunus trituberculatus]|uniref:glycine receptor subunit alpha-2-like n=1 Tax=Portunus trituberculatus TaxID=210409 RepID=UPI001E1CDBAB|nr:glycine receptor subunit alpha-2-like [Portunus trituberculatus]